MTPLATAATWLATFFGLAVGGILLPELCPPELRVWVAMPALGAVLVSVLCFVVSRWEDPARQYPMFRIGAFVGVTIFGVVFALAPQALPVTIVVSLGIPLQACHSLKFRALTILMLYWTALVLGGVAYALSDGVDPEIALPIAIMVVPLTWLLTTLSFQLSDDRSKTIDRNTLMTLRDSQTGLANRRGLRAVAKVMERDEELAGLMLIDLDNFKLVNTLFGHPGGDRVIRDVAEAIEREFGDEHLTVRLGGDEFVVVLRGAELEPGWEDRESRRVAQLAEQLGEKLALGDFKLGASVGAARYGVDGDGLNDLLRVAELRLASSKRAAHRADAQSPSPGPHEKALEFETPQTAQAGVVARVSIVQRRALGALASTALLLATIPLLTVDASDRIMLVVIALLLPPMVAPRELPGVSRESSVRRLLGFLAYPMVGVAAAVSGGAAGPALPILVMLIGYDARDDDTRSMYAKLVFAELAALSPLVYLTSNPAYEFELALGVMAAFVVMLPVVLGLMARNRTLLERARHNTRMAASLDPLTGALNRGAFELAAVPALVEYKSCAVVMIDLDNFKGVNTVEGYDAGDELLGEIGTALSAVTRSRRQADLLGRVGGDEFAALLVDVSEMNLRATAQRFIDAVDKVAEGGSPAAQNVSASCGIAISPQHGVELATLMGRADRMLMQVKAEGKSSARIDES
jgi:diguanylate cyclase (GGDEF)-like protein